MSFVLMLYGEFSKLFFLNYKVLHALLTIQFNY